MMEIETHAVREMQIESYVASGHTIDINQAEKELHLTNMSSVEEHVSENNATSDSNVGGNTTSPAKNVEHHMTNEEENGQSSVNNVADEQSVLPDDQLAEAETFEPVQIKEEKQDTDYTSDEEESPDNNAPFPEEGMSDHFQIKEEQDIKSESESYDSYSDDSCSDEEELWNNLVSKERHVSNGDGLRTSDVSNKDYDADGSRVNNVQTAEDGITAEKEVTTMANGADNDASSPASPVSVKKTRKKGKEAEKGSPNLDVITNTREKRTAFKKCTEWFKLLSGELVDKYTCPSCNRGFSSKQSLKEHQLVHRKVKHVDDRIFEPAEVKTERVESQNGKFKCSECGIPFSSKSLLKRHEKKHSDEPVHSCRKCSGIFAKRNALLAHMKTHSDRTTQLNGKITQLKTAVSRIRKYKCKECDAKFTQLWSLEQHRIVHSKACRYFECAECDKTFTDVSLLAKHQESHIGRKSYGCGDCNERFSQKTALIKHQITHIDRRKAECTECKKTFSDRSALRNHQVSVHGTENMCFCTKCDKSFLKRTSLKRHMLTHSHNHKPFQCSICKEIFAQKSTLTRHALLHGGEQFYRFTCSVCDRKFSRRETLTDHMRTHTGERPHVCAVCHEGFTQKSAMRRHQILHFKEKRGKNSLPELDVDTGATDDILLSLVYSDN